MHAFIIHVNIFYIYIMCVHCILCIIVYTHICMFVFKKNVVHILNACIYNTCKYVLCIYCMCVYMYIYIYIYMSFILDVI